jgi:hypothetical protein
MASMVDATPDSRRTAPPSWGRHPRRGTGAAPAVPVRCASSANPARRGTTAVILVVVDLPTAGPGPLLRPALLGAGITDDELRRLRRRGELAPLAAGAYVDPADPRLRRPGSRHALLVAAALPRVAADAVVSHVSAAVLHGLPVWDVPLGRVHTTRPRRSGGLRTGRLHVHTAPLDPEDVVDLAGTAVTSVERTLLDLGRTVGFEQAVVPTDAARRRHLTDRAALLAALGRVARWPGAPRARRVVAFADPGADGVGESRSRVAMARFGVLPPVLQWPVVGPDGRVLGTADFGWPEHGVAGEFDGLVEYGRLVRAGQVPADVLVDEKRREDAMRSVLRGVVRWTWGELGEFTAVAGRLPR